MTDPIYTHWVKGPRYLTGLFHNPSSASKWWCIVDGITGDIVVSEQLLGQHHARSVCELLNASKDSDRAGTHYIIKVPPGVRIWPTGQVTPPLRNN